MHGREQSALADVFQQLDHMDRRILLMHYADGLTTTEAAAALEQDHRVVARRLVQIRELARGQLQACEPRRPSTSVTDSC